ncbi:MAG: hypothetical protein AAF387_03505 [Pseudomonadota bacterium]
MPRPDRGPYDALKDAGRKPPEMMSFFGIESGMTVLDLLTGSGYSAEILSAAVGLKGVVYAQNSFLVLKLIGGEHHRGMMKRLEGNRLPNVRYVVMEPSDLPFEASLDFAMWAYNIHDDYHDGGEETVLNVLKNIKRGLKPNGILAISDHVGIAEQDNAKLHRTQPKIVHELIEKAEFIVEAESDNLVNPDDDHTQVIFEDGIRYKTDQLLIRARKP